MDEPLHRVEISGAVIASMLRECGSSRGDSDGILFGRVHKRRIANFQDDEQGMVEEVTAIVTGAACMSSLLSFYDAAGDVDMTKLGRIVGERARWGGDPVIGWLVCRRNTPMRPSMREVAVSASLVADRSESSSLNGATGAGLVPYLSSSDDSSDSSIAELLQPKPLQSRPGEQVLPRLFFLLTEFDADEVHTHEYRAFEFREDTGMQPRSVVVRNVGQSSDPKLGQQRGLYGSFVPVAPLPWSTSTTTSDEADSWSISSIRSSKQTGMSHGSRDQELLNMYAEGVSVQQLHAIERHGSVQEMEAMYRGVMLKFEQLSQRVRHSAAAVHEQELENARLKRAAACARPSSSGHF